LAGVDAGLLAFTLLLLAVLGPLLVSHVLDEQVGLVLALAVSVVGSAAVYLIRGTTGGQRRFGRYASTVLIDGAVRMIGCAVLVLIGSTDAVAFGLALCLGPIAAAVLTARGSGPPAGGIPAQLPANSLLSRDVALLLVASSMAMVMANVAPVVVTAMLPGDPATAAGFAGAVVLTRVPLLFMGPIQALLLPAMTAAAATGDRARLSGIVRRGLALIAAIGVIGVIGTALFGRPLIALLFGADRDTTWTVPLLWLTASAAVFMAVQLVQPAMVALRLHRALVLAWVAGVTAFCASLLTPVSPVDRGVLAQIVGPVVTLLILLAVLAGHLRSAKGSLTPPAEVNRS